MEKLLPDLISFLLNNHKPITSEPINGSLVTIYSLFNDPKRVSYNEFTSMLDTIASLDKYSLELKYEDPIDPQLTFINTINLSILLKTLTGSSIESHPPARVTPSPPTSPASKLNALLSYNTAPSKLSTLLKYQSAQHKLSKEKIQLTVPRFPFIETCDNPTHQRLLINNSNSNNNNINKEKHSKELANCVATKIHFIPVIKPQTELSLGDCSYLDTCHKLDTCRYVHYTKLIPTSKLEAEIQECEVFNSNLMSNEKCSLFNSNGSISNISRSILPSQWINCDVRQFDFKILGKFAAVIADPAWNIHMNVSTNKSNPGKINRQKLPYGTCNDNELMDLPLSTIQDEGVLFLWVTGRSIEIGKVSLERWGYRILNEMIWIKTNQLVRTICTGRTGHWLNHSKEHLLVGIKGNPKWLNKLTDVDYLVSSTRETSRKPDELYEMIERLVGPHARKLEIFGRDHNTRPGWMTIGNQLSGVNIYEHDIRQKYNVHHN